VREGGGERGRGKSRGGRRKGGGVGGRGVGRGGVERGGGEGGRRGRERRKWHLGGGGGRGGRRDEGWGRRGGEGRGWSLGFGDVWLGVCLSFFWGLGPGGGHLFGGAWCGGLRFFPAPLLPTGGVFSGLVFVFLGGGFGFVWVCSGKGSQVGLYGFFGGLGHTKVLGGGCCLSPASTSGKVCHEKNRGRETCS